MVSNNKSSKREVREGITLSGKKGIRASQGSLTRNGRSVWEVGDPSVTWVNQGKDTKVESKKHTHQTKTSVSSILQKKKDDDPPASSSLPRPNYHYYYYHHHHYYCIF